VRRVFIGLESINPDSLVGARKKQNKVAEYRKMLLEWKKAGAIIFAGYILGFPEDTPESVLRDIEIIQRELPIDLLEPHCLTALPGSEDHQRLHKLGAFLDPDLNKYDLEHVTTVHPQMSTAQWEKLYHDSWKNFYSLQHIETVLRRAMATGVSIGNTLTLLLWFHFCVVYENVDPLQGGLFRRKYRRDRRPTLPIESPFVFYPRVAADFVYKHFKLAQLIWRFGRFRKKLEKDPNSRKHSDIALIADLDLEDSSEPLEVLTAHGASKLTLIQQQNRA
jgi:hypothetical protein